LSVEPLAPLQPPAAPTAPRGSKAPVPRDTAGARRTPDARTPAPAASPAAVGAEITGSYQLIQVSAVHDIRRGRQLQQRLQLAGFDSYWESVRTAEGDEVRIRVSVERRSSTIADALSTLRRLGYDPVLVGGAP
jgi:cell division septation protein DedD